MAGTVHALLVGIDAYPDPRHRLSGCRNDVEEMAALLALRVPTGSLRLARLLDSEASRESVIDTFRKHLGQAKAGDTALFFYAGHGSRERAPEVFWPIEPDRLDETLVLWDSRTPGGWDLADKELAALIRPLSKAGVHVVVILDSCHSGSGTRDISAGTRTVRRFPLDVRDRPIETFLPEVQTVAAERDSESGWRLGEDGRHILLAACREDEEAAESIVDEETRGMFSYYLLEALREITGSFSYRDLAASVRARVIGANADQNPQIEATLDEDLDRQFLNGAVLPRVTSYVASENDGEWWMNGGRLHGIPLPMGDEHAQVALFAAAASAQEMGNLKNAKVVGTLDIVEPLRSRLTAATDKLESGKTYKAVVMSNPAPMRFVRITGDASAISLAQNALTKNVFVAEGVNSNGVADFELECQPAAFRIRRAVDRRELAAPATSAAEAAKILEHITRWQHFAELENPVSSIVDSDFDVTILQGSSGDTVIPGSDVRLTATRKDKKIVPPLFRVRVRNHGTRDLHVAILALDEMYECSVNLVKGGVAMIKPGEQKFALDGSPLECKIPTALRAEGRTESRDILKVIVSTAPFDVSSARMSALDAVPSAKTRSISVPTNTLDRLLTRGQSRTISAASDSDSVNDFATRTLFVTTVEPPDTVPLTDTIAADVGSGVVIDAHPSFRARARLATIGQTRSDVGASIQPPIFRNDTASETVYFTSSRGTSPGLSVLELQDVSDYSAVTPDAPLIVHLPTATVPGDVIMPVGFDGEDYLVLGHGGASANGTTVAIARLPYPVSSQSRSLHGSIKILFKKFTSPLMGKKYEYPILAGATWDDEGEVTYDHDIGSLKKKVANAKRVVVWVHGIIGDTLAMGARVPEKPGDLYLAFDYENIHTTNEKNAERLQERLADIGLDNQHKKDVVIVAHSMGGLITRWFMEKLSGREVVSRVILCGTPNAGSNWSTIEDFVTGAASLAINNLTKASWEAKLVGALFSGLEKIDVTMDQMKPNSPFLQSLANLPDPAIPYTVLAGNTSLSGAADGPRIKRILKKVMHTVASTAFLFEPNDLAVSVTSIGAVGSKWAKRPDTLPVACDHLSYFSNDASVNELKKLLG